MSTVAERLQRFSFLPNLEQRENLNPHKKILIVSDVPEETVPLDLDTNGHRRRGRIMLSGGLPVQLKNTIVELQRAGHEVELIDPSQYHFLKIENPANLPLVFNPLGFIGMKKKITEYQPDAVLLMSAELPFGLSSYALKACEQLGVPKATFFSGNVFAGIPHYYRSKVTQNAAQAITRIRLRNVFNRSERVFVYTPGGKKVLQDIGVDEERIAVWPGGVDAELFRPQLPNERNPYKDFTWWRSEKKTPILIYYGRLAPEKDIEKFLDMETPPGFQKVVIGGGFDEYANELTNRYKNNNNIHFLGQMTQAQLAPFVRFSQAFIFPSKFDTFGLVAVESAASGTPVVAYNVTGPGEVIEDGITGALVPEDGSLWAGVEKALKIDRNACALAARSKYSWKSATEALLSHLPYVDHDFWESKSRR